jgi:hypothetical protein
MGWGALFGFGAFKKYIPVNRTGNIRINQILPLSVGSREELDV